MAPVSSIKWPPILLTKTPAPDPTLAAPFPDLATLLAASAAPESRKHNQRARSPSSADTKAPYRVGEPVRHPQFGQGLVVAVEAQMAKRQTEWYVTVEFQRRGLVKLLARIAPLERMRDER